MHEQFKNDVIRHLYDKLTVEQIREVSVALDLAGAKYDIGLREMHLALRSAEGLELIRTYAAAKAVEGQSKQALENSMYALRHFFDTVMLPPNQVTTRDIRLYLFNYKTERGISDRSLDKVRQRLSSFFSWALDEGYIDNDPTHQIKKIKYAEPQRKALSQLDLEKLRQACETDRETMLIEVLYSTGCRISEALSIKVLDVDFASGEVTVLGKGKKYRTVYLNAKALLSMQRYLDGRGFDSPYLFVGDRAPHDVIKPNFAQKIIAKIAKRAGFQPGEVTPHILRHTFATTMLQNGGKVQSVQKALGHSSINTTMIYAEVDNEQVKAEVKKTVI